MQNSSDVRVSLYLLTVCLPLGTVLIVFAMKYLSAAFQARAKCANDAQYQALAEKVTTAQAETAASLVAIRAEISKLSASLAAVESVLKQVE